MRPLAQDMIEKAQPKALAPVLRRRINKWAHGQGQRHEAGQRAAFLEKIDQAIDAGAGFDELAALVDLIEAML
jgi:hypothetical protein